MKNGFTLIELLAVIVILAIISLIAVPIVINIIDDTKKISEEKTIDLYIKSIERTITLKNLNRKFSPNVCQIQKNGIINCVGNIYNYSKEDLLKIEMSGDIPDSGVIIIENGKVVNIFNLTLNNKIYNYNIDKKTKIMEVPNIPGLYDENYKLIASWNELINSYGLDITKDYDSFNKSGTMYNIIENNEILKKGRLLIISSDVINIGKYSIASCDKLESIVIPKSVTSIGESAFNGSGIINISFEDNINLAEIKKGTFYNCPNLINVKIPNSVISIGESAFNGSNLSSIIFESESQLMTLGKGAFYNCTNLENIIIPNTVTSIGMYAFLGCSNLNSIVFENNIQLTSISKGTFNACTKLKKITIPKSVVSIEESAFNESGLNNVIFESESQLTTLGKGAFYNCSDLKSIKIPKSVTSIGESAFNGSNLSSIIFENGSQLMTLGKGSFYNCKNLKSINLPSALTRIGESAFNGSGLLTIDFGNNSQLTNIEKGAFNNCVNLESMIIPSNVTNIGMYAFQYCDNLKKVIFENTNDWYISSSATATTGDNIEVSDMIINASNLKEAYKNKYWKRRVD